MARELLLLVFNFYLSLRLAKPLSISLSSLAAPDSLRGHDNPNWKIGGTDIEISLLLAPLLGRDSPALSLCCRLFTDCAETRVNHRLVPFQS